MAEVQEIAREHVDKPAANGYTAADEITEGAAPTATATEAPPAEPSRPQSSDAGTAERIAPAPEPPADRAAPRRAGWLRPVLLAGALVVLVLAATVGYRYFQYASTHTSTDDAYLTSDIVQIAPQVSGTIKHIYAAENQQVKAGVLLVTLDDATYRANVEQARANLDAAIAQAKGAGVGVALTAETGTAQVQQAQGGVEQARSAILSARADVARQTAAVATASANAASAQAGIGNAQAALASAIAGRGRAVAALKSAEAQVQQAQAGVQSARAAVDAAQAAYQRAASDARRYSALAAEGAVSPQAAEAATTTATSAQAQVRSAEQGVASAQATVVARQADVNAARQQVDAAGAAIAQARSGIVAAREQTSAARAGISQAEAQRRASAESVQQAQAKLQQAVGQLNQARTVPHQVAVSQSAHAQATAKIEQARAALRNAEIQLNYCRIYAPSAGQVSKKTIEEGSLVQPGTPLMSIVQRDPWVVANFKETQLARMRPGQPAEVDVDALPGVTFRGHVSSLAPATGATFALLPPDNATGNFTKVVQRVPIHVDFEPNQTNLDRLAAGMSASVSVKVR